MDTLTTYRDGITSSRKFFERDIVEHERAPEFEFLEPTPVFDEFWRFLGERQKIFIDRNTAVLPPWTSDPILRVYKFTNVYRASDRVSQYLIRNVIYRGDPKPVEVMFRTLLFKLFNKIETWELLEQELGPISSADFRVDKFCSVLNSAMGRGDRIYSGAYIMPAGTKIFNSNRKHEAHLRLLQFMLHDKLDEKVLATRNLNELFLVLRSYPLIGDFLAFQYAIDINYSEITHFAESEFVVAGPGARSGLRKCFGNLGGVTEEYVIRLVTDLQEQEFERRSIAFKRLGGRKLQLIDVQNVFCEIDKYARVRFPETLGQANRRRIKQLFKPNLAPIDQWYPPKWGVNENL